MVAGGRGVAEEAGARDGGDVVAGLDRGPGPADNLPRLPPRAPLPGGGGVPADARGGCSSLVAIAG